MAWLQLHFSTFNSCREDSLQPHSQNWLFGQSCKEPVTFISLKKCCQKLFHFPALFVGALSLWMCFTCATIFMVSPCPAASSVAPDTSSAPRTAPQGCEPWGHKANVTELLPGSTWSSTPSVLPSQASSIKSASYQQESGLPIKYPRP